MPKNQLLVIDVETGETTYRDFTSDEIAQAEIDEIASQARIAQEKLVEQAKLNAQEKLAKLGLSFDDLKALGL